MSASKKAASIADDAFPELPFEPRRPSQCESPGADENRTLRGSIISPLPDLQAFEKDSSIEKKKRYQNIDEEQPIPTPVFYPPTPMKSPGGSRIYADIKLSPDDSDESPGRRKSFPGHMIIDDDTTDFFKNEFQDLGVVGRGDFGVVYKARWKVDGKCYAVKKSKRQFRGAADRQRALQEVEHYATLCKVGDEPHPNCVQYYRAWENRGLLYIQTELCDRGTLKEYMECSRSELSEPRIWGFLADLCVGLEYIHRRG